VGALGRADLADDPRYRSFEARAANAPPLFETLRQVIAAQPIAAVLEKLRADDVLADRVNGFDDWLADPHVAATGGAVEIAPQDMPAFKVPRTPGVSPEADRALSPAPHVGEHSAAILEGLGVAGDRIAALAAEGAIGMPGGLL
jgi:crotonobetainyl-CoA:carnitine CoA-transferase CaiB-like acyl-CoA transferase